MMDLKLSRNMTWEPSSAKTFDQEWSTPKTRSFTPCALRAFTSLCGFGVGFRGQSVQGCTYRLIGPMVCAPPTTGSRIKRINQSFHRWTHPATSSYVLGWCTCRFFPHQFSPQLVMFCTPSGAPNMELLSSPSLYSISSCRQCRSPQFEILSSPSVSGSNQVRAPIFAGTISAPSLFTKHTSAHQHPAQHTN